MFSVNSYIKIWKSIDKGNYHECQVSSSVKNKQTGNYETDFSAIVRFIGKAHNQRPMADQRIKLLNCGVTNKYDKEKKITYTNYVVFDYELEGGNSEIASAPILSEEELPF